MMLTTTLQRPSTHR